MPVPAQVPYTSSIANGVSVVFPYNFLVNDVDTLAVRIGGVQRFNGVDFTVSGIGNDTGGNVTFFSPPGTGLLVERERVVPYQRETDYQNLGDLLAGTLDSDQDDQTMQIQQLARLIANALIYDPVAGGYDLHGHILINSGNGSNDNDVANIAVVRAIAEAIAAGIPGGIGTFFQSGSTFQRTFQDKMREIKSTKDWGAVADGATDDLAAINSALANASGNSYTHVDMPTGVHKVSSLPTNPAGAALSGLGSLVMNDPLFPGYTKRLDSYTDMGYAMNREHLYRAYQRMFLGPSGGSAILNVITYGDSTVANYVASGFLDGQYWTENLVPELFASRGINSICTNKAVAGTNWNDLNAIADVGTSVDLMIIKYGINDAINPVGTRLQTMVANMRAKLSAIRSTAGGTPATLSIIVMGPNATIDPANGRDEIWYEQLRSAYIDVCNQYGCAYFDTYAWLKDLRQGAGGNWMDLVSNVSIHPLDIGKIWQFGGMIESFFPLAQIERFRTNRFFSSGTSAGNAVVADLPPSYIFGVTLKTCLSSAGWPLDGAVETIRAVDGYTVQRCYNFAQGPGNMPTTYTRTGTGGSWSPWSSAPQLLTLSNGGSSLGGYQAAQAKRSMEGHVQLSGVITGGTVANGTVIMTLPAGYRPTGQVVFCLGNSTASPTVVSIQTAGTVTILHNGDTSYMGLDNIAFYAAS